MRNLTIYEQLAKHLDQWVVGTPISPAALKILETLFPDEEAEIAVKLPLQNKTLEELQTIYPDRKESLQDTLTRMVERGTVYTSQRPGQERKYRLLPSIVGWAETPFWSGKENDETRKLGPLWVQYRNEAFGRELARGGMPLMRVVPISRSLADNREVLPFDDLKPRIESASFRAVAHCPCRLMKKTVDEGCDHALENCLHFGSMGRYMVAKGIAREVTAQETFEILKDANEDSLVHIVDNFEGHMSTICNCCGCCCIFLDTQKKMGLHTLSSSNYVASVDVDECVGCGTCESRCPVEAISLTNDIAAVDEQVCLGCAVCVPTCSAEAVDIVKRSEIKPPPDLAEFLTRRLKSAHE